MVRDFLAGQKDTEPKKDKPPDSDIKLFTSTDDISIANRDISNKLVDDIESMGVNWDDNGEKLASGFSRTTDPNSSFSDIEGAWDDEIKKHPGLKQVKDNLDDYANQINKSVADKFRSATSVYRGTSHKELDRLLDKGVVEPYQYNFISYTLDKESGMGFGLNAGGVTVEYDKKSIMSQDIPDMTPVKYTPYSNYAGVGEDKDRDYPISFADEMEVRSNWFKADASTVKSITLHKDKFDADEFSALVAKYRMAFGADKVNIR